MFRDVGTKHVDYHDGESRRGFRAQRLGFKGLGFKGLGFIGFLLGGSGEVSK